MFYPPSIRTTHKPNRKPRFSHTYAVGPDYQYLFDNEMVLFLMTVSTYKTCATNVPAVVRNAYATGRESMLVKDLFSERRAD